MSLRSYNKFWVHFIWETFDGEKIFSKEQRKNISNLLYDYCKEKKIFMKINFVNADHVHALIDLPTNLSIEDCIKLLKGGSSFYINKERLTKTKFSWGKGYGAFSVSASQLKNVIEYIRNQEEHHKIKSFTEEYELFMKMYGYDLLSEKNR